MSAASDDLTARLRGAAAADRRHVRLRYARAADGAGWTTQRLWP